MRKDPYAILGLGRGASLSEIKRAYRRLAFAVHPDAGAKRDADCFREVHEAYQVLSDAEQRRYYDRRAVRVRVEPVPPLRRRQPIDIPDDFVWRSPPLDEFLDHVAQNFFGFHRKSAGPTRRLGLEIVLSPEEARFGCRLPIDLPVYLDCSRCDGSDTGWGVCPTCHGYGKVEASETLWVDILPGARKGTQYEVTLREAGIKNLILDITLIVS
jgi:molecular chaperone DnaJ